MKIIDSLRSIFDRCDCDFMVEKDTWTVEEENTSASFNKLTIKRGGALFCHIGNHFYKGLSGVTSDRSSFLEDVDCDGVVFCLGQGRESMILVDLKSSFSENNIAKALSQALFTFLKLQMPLSLCSGYDINDLDLIFCVACNRCADESCVLDNILASEELGEDRFENRYLKSFLLNNEPYSCCLRDWPRLSGIQLSDALLSKKVNLQILTPDQIGEKTLCVELNADNSFSKKG